VVALFALSFDSVNLDSDDFEDIHSGTSGTDLMDVDDVFRENFEQKYTYPALEIAYIAVRKDRRGENIGIDLVNEIAEWAKKQDMAGCVFLTVNALHTKEYSAVRFYEKCKFAKLTPVPQMDVWPMFKTLWIKDAL
ncbi:MAG: GNAT family N-acetyltransferase, partial [Parabacteroides sp.]